jgi:Helix-turn-helix domain
VTRKREPVAYLTKYAEKSSPVDVPVPTCDRLWNAHDVSAFLGVPVATLHQWRYYGTGPPAFKVGRHLRYDPAAVRRWLVEDCRSERGS